MNTKALFFGTCIFFAQSSMGHDLDTLRSVLQIAEDEGVESVEAEQFVNEFDLDNLTSNLVITNLIQGITAKDFDAYGFLINPDSDKVYRGYKCTTVSVYSGCKLSQAINVSQRAGMLANPLIDGKRALTEPFCDSPYT